MRSGPGSALRLAGPAQQLAVEVIAPDGDAVEAGDGVEQRRLAAARRADDHADLAGRDVSEQWSTAITAAPSRVVDLDDVVDADRRRGGPPAARPRSDRRLARLPLPSHRPQRELAHAPLHQVVAEHAHHARW